MFRFNKHNLLLLRNCLTLHAQGLHKTKTTDINKILIANRGEIACRILRTAKKLGIKTVAVYSDVDKNSMHVDLADEAYFIGPALSTESYLRQDKIISVAKKAKCQAIHPGYGFLSENAEFAELCLKQNVIFIGPPANAIRDMGIKSTSKSIMATAGVPIIQGYHGNNQTNETLLSEAKKIGFPLMIKAIRGGGGKGMKIALNESEFIEALESARRESQKSFGDSSILLEKYVVRPRHIEVQIFADRYGDTIHLFERDCSIQRRHQKIIEEAPAPNLSEKLRSKLGAAAVRAAKAVGYIGAGTVEFIMNQLDNSFFFMEMNTRLQVEHPVTEAITGLDLVEWQLKVAAGEKLPLKQEDINIKGHAFEARIYAENPRNSFLPDAGYLKYLRIPETSTNVRIETGVRQNDEVSVHYDPMIAKLVVWGDNRHEALKILRSKLCQYNIAGFNTNIDFIKDICLHPDFQNGQVHTGFIEENSEELFPRLYVPNEILAQAALALILYEEIDALNLSLKSKTPFNPFTIESGFRLNHILNRTFNFNIENETNEVNVEFIEPEIYSMNFNRIGPWKKVTGTLKNNNGTLELSSEIDKVIAKANVTKLEDKLYLFTNERTWQLNIPCPTFLSKLTNSIEETADKIISPMPGSIEKICVKENDTVKKGDPLLVVVAMKMEHIIKTPVDGVIENLLCCVGDKVSKDKLLVKLKEVPVQKNGKT